MSTATITAPPEMGEPVHDHHDDDKRNLQLSFDLGVPLQSRPDYGTVKISGSLQIDENLKYGEHVTVKLVNMYGVEVAEAPATIGYPTFKDHFSKEGDKTIERVHTASVDKPEFD